MKKFRTSDTREAILKYIQDFIEERGYSPTVRDIVKGCGLSSTAVVQHHLNVLEKTGYILRDAQVVRSIQLVEKDVLDVPLLGTIAAGKPIPVPNSDGWVTPPEETLKLTLDTIRNKTNIYALKVKGMSMLDALIDDGDIVIMEAVQTAEEGDMVAVWLKDEQEVTLKKIYHELGRMRLQPANTKMEPIYTNPENIEVQGKVLAVLRMLGV